MSNLLRAIINIANATSYSVAALFSSQTKSYVTGDAFERYVKDAFCNSFAVLDGSERNSRYSEEFSYIGNQNNPPDFMIKGGDAVIVKKVEHTTSVLTSYSHPKDKLYADSPIINAPCRNCEDWDVKDVIYAVGTMSSNRVTNLCFVYGEDYAAESSIYERIGRTIKEGIAAIPEVEFSQTKELGWVTKVDPLGITNLRIRGLWSSENPYSVFDYVYTKRTDDNLDMFAIINLEKYASFPLEDRQELEAHPNLSVTERNVKDPSNPAKLKPVKLIYLK